MATTTAVVQIGNSDNRLTQAGWAEFAADTRRTLESHGKLHFFGGSEPFAEWQNACFVLEFDPELIPDLELSLTRLRRAYKQDAIALTVGTTQFI